ncbi:MAG: response regulator transcription factor [candidate division NC10 bacterium]|nr:response regulator transcription factor [candidate division NC10 bacterium]
MIPKIRVLVADDHTIVREGIRALLQARDDIEIIGEAGDGREAVEKVRQLEPDVVLMDISMPGMDGLEATRQIKKENPKVRVLALTMHDNEEYLFQILRMGGSGYILKRATAAELVSAIKAVHRGEAFLYPSMAKTLVEDYLRRVEVGTEKSSYDGLTNREREILKLIAEGHTNQEIADILCLSVKTVQAHRSHIMEKLGMHDRSELVKYAIRRGLIEP